MRPLTLAVLVLILVLLGIGPALVGAALAGDAPAPTGWAAVDAALAEVALSAVGILGALVALALAVLVALRPIIVAAAAAWIEQATSARVARVDAAIDTALAAGKSPAEAAEIVAAKLPQTLRRSGKGTAEIAAEAEVRRRAAGGRD